MRKTMLILLLYPLLLVSCNKEKHQIPDEYSFLIGKWECTNCDNHTVVSIEKDRLAIASYKNRQLYGRLNNVETIITPSGSTIVKLIKSNNTKIFVAILYCNMNNTQNIRLITNDAYSPPSYYEINYQLKKLSE